MEHERMVRLSDYAPLVGDETIERIRQKGESLRRMRVVNVNSTYYGGGVSVLLSSLTLLMNELDIQTGWRIIHGPPDFFAVTKKIHNALQGGEIGLTEQEKKLYQYVVTENAIRNHLNHDYVVIHDPQPLPLIKHYRKHGPWIWRCHIDLSQPNPDVFDYLKPMIEEYDAIIVSLEEYKQDLQKPQICFMPAIDPFTITNRDMSEEEMEAVLDEYNIALDRPLIAQVSRFDPWKDPEGVIRAFQMARKEVDCQLLMLGNVATDDPEGARVYASLRQYEQDDPDITLLSAEDTALVNAVQRKAAVILQKSIREGFGLTVTEAMWKGTPVIGGNVGGIRHQIEDGVNGFLVDSSEQAAERIVQLVENPSLRSEMGWKAKETVQQRFLMTRLLEQELDLFNSFEDNYRFQEGALEKLQCKQETVPARAVAD